MTDYAKKQEKAIDKIAEVLTSLDKNLNNIDAEVAKGKEHSLKCWFEEKKATHDIKKILHEVDKYDKYDEKELDEINKEYAKQTSKTDDKSDDKK